MPWDFRDDIPIYAQLIAQLQQQIVSGRLQPGERLLPVRELAAEAGVNPNTMQRALMEMERQGLVFSQRTAGRFVTQDLDRVRDLKTDLARERVQAFLEDMAGLGFRGRDVLALIEKEGACSE